MSEEVADSGMSVPRAMFWSVSINASIGFVALVTFLFSMPSVDDAINDASGYALVYVLNLAGSPSLTLGLMFLQLLLALRRIQVHQGIRFPFPSDRHSTPWTLQVLQNCGR